MSKVEQKVYSYIAHKGLLKPGQRVLIALSGGADSVCLLLLLHKLGYECYAAHCNFHLRGEESLRDQQFVSSLCGQMSIPLFVTEFDTQTYASQNNISIEMAARKLRYAFFARLLAQNSIHTLAVGHHLGDNVETMLLNAVRGTGVKGLAGIQASRPFAESAVSGSNVPTIVRPLLSITHDEITDYLESLGQMWVEDSTNKHDDVARNVVRINVIPQLQRINQSAVQNIATTIDNLHEVERVYRYAIARDIAGCLVDEGVLSVEKLFLCVSPRSVLHEWLNGKGFNRVQEDNILSAAERGQSGKMFISDITDGERLLIDRGALILESSQHYLSESDVTMTTAERSAVTILPSPDTAYLDADKVCGQLIVRNVMPQDSFQPFGMRGNKLLSDYMTDQKLNVFQKEQQLVVCDDCNIAWVVGLRSSEKFRVDDDTTRVIICSVTK